MISPETIAKQMADRQAAMATGLGQEGMIPTIQPRRSKKKWIVLAAIVGLVWWGWKVYATPEAKPEPIPVVKETPVIQPVQQKPIMAQKLMGEERERESEIAIEWVYGRVIGLKVDGKTYDARPGDRIGDVSVGMSGPNWADVSYRGNSRRYVVPLPVAKGNSARKGGSSGVDSAAGPRSNQGRSVFSAAK